MVRFLLILILLTGFASCIDQVDLSIRAEEPRLVVEGQINNEAPPYTVRLTYTGKFGGSGGQNPASQFVRAARLSLADDQGQTTRFAETSPGVYQTSDLAFRGQTGRAYSLSITLGDGKRYMTKPEIMPAVPAIDSVSARLVRVENIVTPYRFAYSITTRDPATEKNYYRWTAYGITTRLSVGVSCSLGSPNFCNQRCWITVPNNAINIYSDEAVNGNTIRGRAVLQLPVYATGPQLVEVLQYGMTQVNYQFWRLYQQQDTRTGSIFDPLPAPITGNVVNAADPADRARGYFAVVSVTRKRYRNQAPELSRGGVASFISGQLIPPGDCRATYGQAPVDEPVGW